MVALLLQTHMLLYCCSMT